MRGLHQEIRYCTSSDGTRIAYATMGEGPPLVKTPNWFGVEYELESPIWRHFVEAPARNHHLIRFDQRGCGLSQRDIENISLEAWVNDLEAVVDAAGVQRFPLLGISQGGPMALEYAWRHPDRVTCIVLYGSMVNGVFHYGTQEEMDESRAVITLVREGWTRENPVYRDLMSSVALPDATTEQRAEMSALEQKSVSAPNAARILTAIASLDVTSRLPEITPPVLITHSLEDQLVPFSHAQTLAAKLPNARLVALDSKNHGIQASEPAWRVLVSEMDEFLGAEYAGLAAAAAGTEGILSDREIEVLRLLATGRSNQQIADELVISLNTVRRHVSNVFDKTGAANRAQAAVYAKEQGLI
jgi:pimeloyl-ACP methyl ester carboxylesterase/DNA-binding CsgD family transcriptional regulator